MKQLTIPLRYKLLVLVLLLLILILLIATPWFIAKQKDILYENLIKRGQTLVNNFALSCENLLITSDELGLEDVVSVVVREKDVLSAYILLKDLTYFLHSDSRMLGKKYILPEQLNINLEQYYNILTRDEEVIYQFFYPVYKTSSRGVRKPFGTAYIEITTKFINQHINQLKREVIFTFILIFLLGAIGTIFLSSLIVNPINKLTQSTQMIASGHLHHRIKVTTGDEIEILAQEFNKMTAQLERAQKELIKKKLVEQELKIAQSIQKDVVHERIPPIPGYQFVSFYKPAREIGGDYYSVIDINKKLKGFIVADVSGKGVPAALILNMFHIIIHFYFDARAELIKLMDKISSILSHYLRKGNFITSIIGHLDILSHTFKYVSTGHEPVLHYISKKRSVKMIKSSGIPIGLVNHKIFKRELAYTKVKMNRNDLLILFTDGIRNLQKGQSLSNEGLIKYFRMLLRSDDPLKALKNRLKSEIYSPTRHYYDDITILILKRVK